MSAANQGAFNVANALGASLGALVISAGFGYTAPMWVGAALAAVGALVATAAHLTGRRSARLRPVPSSGEGPRLELPDAA